MDPFKTVAELQPARKAFSLAEEFKSFAFKGNIIDLAVGVIIGTAFAKIISSLVGDVLMPLITAFAPGDQQYKELVWVVNGKEVHYGQFLAELINFVLIALVLFVFIVKFLGWILRFRKEEAAVPPPPTKEQELLTEIRDLLKRTCPPEAAPSATPAGGAPSSPT